MRCATSSTSSRRCAASKSSGPAAGRARTPEAYDLALLRYREGIGNYLQVLSAEAPLLSQQSLDAELRARQLAFAIDLVRALGGGFDPRRRHWRRPH